MASGTTVLNTDNQLYINRTLETLFLGDNQFNDGEDYTNSTGSSVTLSAGTLMGRISASGLLLPHVSTASDGSQFPVGILTEDVTVADSASVKVNICVGGRFAQNHLTLGGTDTLDTVISGRRLRDRIQSDTLGIKLINVTEHTIHDNS